MFEGKKKKRRRERKKNKEKNPPRHRFKFICVFDESNVRREGECIAATSEQGNVLAARKINFMYGGGI